MLEDTNSLDSDHINAGCIDLFVGIISTRLSENLQLNNESVKFIISSCRCLINQTTTLNATGYTTPPSFYQWKVVFGEPVKKCNIAKDPVRNASVKWVAITHSSADDIPNISNNSLGVSS